MAKKKYIIFTILSIPIIIIFFTTYNIYNSLTYNTEYSIDLNRDNINKSEKPLYILDKSYNGFSPMKLYNNEIYRAILSYPISFIFKPENFLINKKIKVEATAKGNSNLQLGLQCKNCKDGNSYVNFFNADMGNYFPAANFGTTYIYAMENKKWKREDSIKKWIKHNIPVGSAIKSLDPNISQSDFVNSNVNYSKNSATKLETMIKGSQSFYVYLDKKIDLSIKKTYLTKNGTEGDFKINLVNLNNEIVWQSYIPADSLYGDGYSYEYNLEKENPGIYKLSINNPYTSDFTLENIELNSNKIIFDGSSSLKLPANIYTEIMNEKIISFTNLDYVSNQNITIKDNNGIIKKIKIEPIKNVTIKLIRGKYSIQIQGKGFIKIDGLNFSTDKEYYFEPFDYDFSKKTNASFIINKEKITRKDDWITVEKMIDEKRLKELNNKSYLQFSLLPEVEKLADIKDFTPLTGVPLPSDFKNTPQTILNMLVRGDHSFYVLLDNSLDATIYKRDMNGYNGSDEVMINLRTLSGYEVCDSIIADDGITTVYTTKSSPIMTAKFNCNNLKPGVYILSFKELNSNYKDYLIQGLEINTNKIMFKDGLLLIDPMELYINNSEGKILTFNYWLKNFHQNIRFSSKNRVQNVILTTKDITNNVTYMAPAGATTISFQKGSLNISGGNFAIKPEYWFIPEQFKKTGTIYLKNIKVKIY